MVAGSGPLAPENAHLRNLPQYMYVAMPPLHFLVMASQLGPGGIILCAASLSAAACIICVAAVGNPFVLYQYCVPKASLPRSRSRRSRRPSSSSSSSRAQADGADDDDGGDEEQQGHIANVAIPPARISGRSYTVMHVPHFLRPSNWSFFGYAFDLESYREANQIRREQQQAMMVDEQIRRLDQLVATEQELRQRIADGDTDRATRLQLSRVQRFRYALAMRTREERRRRRMEFMRGVLEADEEEQDNHFKHTLTDEEKHQVLDRVLDYHRYNKEAGGRDDSGEDKGDNDASDRKGMGCAGVNIKAALSASIRSRRASDRALGTTTDKEKGEADEDGAEDKEDAKGESSRLCSICLDEYGEYGHSGMVETVKEKSILLYSLGCKIIYLFSLMQ